MLQKTRRILRDEKGTKELEVSAVSEAQNLIQELFPTSETGGQQRSWWAAYRSLGLKSVRRAETLWRGDGTVIHSKEMDALRELKQRKETGAIEAELREAQNEARRVQNRIAALTTALAHVDQDFHGETITALELQSKRPDSARD